MDDVMEVVIIGAGIVGLGTAVAFHKIGIKSVVMEKSESLRNVTGTAIGIRQNGWRALEQLGVADTLRRTAVPIPIERTVVLKEGGRQEESPVIGEFRYLRRKDILDTLYDALPPGTVKFGYQLESIKLDSNTNKPVLRFVNGNTIIAKVVIGCEGGKSIVAEFLNLKPTKTFPLFGTRGLTHYPNGHPFNPEFARFRNDNTLVGRIPLDDNLVYWFFVEPTASKGKKSWEDPEVIRRSTLKLLRDYPQEIQDMIENADTKSLIFLNLRYHSPWDLFKGNFYKGTVAVAGDAMHVMGPFLAQGASTGLEDAIVLARNMAQLGLNAERKITDQGVEEAFKMFVKERRMRVVKLSVQAFLIGILVGATSPIKKLIFLVLLIFLYGNTNGIDYDCGSL